MPLDRHLVLVLNLLASAALSYGCSGSTTESDDDRGGPPDARAPETGGHDAGKDGNTSPDSAGMTCTPDKPLVVIPWAPPTAFHQALCTSAQTSDYVADFAASALPTFRSDSANAACLKCIETMSGATAYGPVITGTLTIANIGGCVAHVEGNTTSTGCGARIGAYNDCAYQECGDCIDYDTGGPMTLSCLKSAVGSGGTCASVWNSTTSQCEMGLDGDAGICSSLSSYINNWCVE
jgi:hypothetical protein